MTVKLKLTLCFLVASISFLVVMVSKRVAEVALEDRLDILFGEIAEEAAKTIYADGALLLRAEREHLKRAYLQEHLQQRAAGWPQEIKGGTRCWYCKGPHFWEWCVENLKNVGWGFPEVTP